MIDKDTILRNVIKIHGDRYNYDNITDINNVNEKLHIICPEHGDFYQTYWNHIHLKRGCRKCGFLRNIETRKLTNEKFIQKSKLTHDDIENYDFSELDVGTKDEKGRIIIKCKKHGEFKMRPSHFMEGCICPYCNGSSKKDNEVKSELSKIHKYLDFSITKFSEHDERYRIKVICPIHGIRNLNYYNLRKGQGCDLCRYKKGGLKQRMSYNAFIKRAEDTFGKGAYIYDKDIMENRDDDGKITVTCPVHGDFKVLLDNFLNRHSGCPICNQSHLEEEVRLFLINNNIDFIQEKTFDWLKDKNNLFLDFYLPNLNTAIECQGIQHFKPIDFFGGENNLLIIERRDDLKYRLCREHNIKLLYFAHNNLEYRYNTITSLKELKEAILS